jgi:hypothetical protein
MDAFSYLSVLLSIILGLAIAQVLQGYRSILLARGRVRHFAPVFIWSLLLLVIYAQAWWASFGLRDRPNWDFLSFTVILLEMVLLYMLAGLVFPDIHSEETVDLADHFSKHRRPFFGFLIAMLTVSVLKDLVLDHKLPSPLNLTFHVVFVATAVVGFLFSGRRTQLGLALFGIVIFFAYITLLFSRL